MIEFESVSKTFRDGTTAVDNLSLVVPSGKITVIVGPSGCGKTTSLRMVNRMLEPSKGKITWDGKSVKSRRKTALRRQMGYVIQSGGLFPHRTVLENIATVPDLLRWDKQKSRKRAVELLGSVGLDRKLGGRYPAQLSGGQQQRVGVARALAADPLVLLMDEPFSAVDPVVRAELHEFFLGLQRELSKTIIMITHDIDEAIKLGDQVAILRVGGKLAQVGTPQQLLDEPSDAFVEGFVGKDRGYRSLSFQPASGLTLGGVQVVREAGFTGGDGPVLVVDGDARPVGWSDPARSGTVMALGATFDPDTDSLRTALDAALTSPVGLAVAVTGASHRYAGVVDADMILRQVTQARAQIAESIAVRTHDEQPATGVPPTSPDGSAIDGAADETAPVADGPDQTPALDDPDATSVRGVPPVESVGTVATVGTVAAAGVAATGWSAEEDPDATRITGPLPEHDEALFGPSEESTADAAAPARFETDGGIAVEAASATEPEPWSPQQEPGFEQQEPGSEQETPTDPESASDPSTSAVSASTGEVSDQGSADERGAPGPTDPEPAGADPYGYETPPTGDESVATAYDAQLARDAAGETLVHPQSTDDAQVDESAPSFESAPSMDDHDQASALHDGPPPAEGPPPADGAPPADWAAGSDDHDREPPR